MYRLFEFIRSIYITLLFIALESVAIYVYISSDSYAQAKLLTYSAGFVSSVDGVTSSVKDYFTLSRQNKILIDKVSQLEMELAKYRDNQRDSLLTAMGYVDDYGTTYTAAHVVSNRIFQKNNYLVINRGLQHGIRGGMVAVTLNNEVVGTVIECSDRYSIVMSVLHSDFRTSGKIEGDPNFAAIRWEGTNHKLLSMNELSRYANIQIGSRVVTTGNSQIFPEGLTIGTISKFEVDPKMSSISAEIELAVDMRSVRDLFIIHDRAIDETNSVINTFFESVR